MDAIVQGANVRGGGESKGQMSRWGYPWANVQGGCPGSTCPVGKRLEGEMSGGGGGQMS